MKNLNIENSNLFRNFALVCSFLLISFNLSAQYAPLATATSFASNSQSNPNTGLDLRYDFGWVRSDNGTSFNSTNKSIDIAGTGSSVINFVKTNAFTLTSSNTIDITYQITGNGGNIESRVARIRNINTNAIASTVQLTSNNSTTINLIPNNLTTGEYLIEFEFVSSSNGRSLRITNFTTDATPSLLPVTYASLSAKLILGSVQVSWSTSMEENNSHFEIERSVDGTNWEMIGSEQGVGFSTEEVSYTFTDFNPAQGTNIYRLKQVDFDATATYSKTMVVINNNSNPAETIQLFPNPSKGVVTIKGVESPKVTVFNTAGTALYVSHNQSSLNLDFLQLGVYFLQIESIDGKVTRHRFLKD
jgi:hypothetical protein